MKKSGPGGSDFPTRKLLHQIRNVMLPLQAHAELLSVRPDRNAAVSRLSSAIVDDLKYLENFLERSSFLIRELELSPLRLNLNDLLASVWHELSARLDVNAVHFSVLGDRCEARIDEYSFRMAINALFENALEATAARKQREIVARLSRKRTVSIAILDNGGPISKTASKQSMQPFYSTKDRSGAGLGLPIALKIIQAHHGTLELVAEKGQTCARIRLPLSR